jgi:hypothetical protein
MRKAQPVAEVAPQLVTIAEILSVLAGNGNPAAWQQEAEEVAATLPGQVVRDWAGRPCLSWTDGERYYLRTLRDRTLASAEQAERLAAIDQGGYGGPGVVGGEQPGEATWQAPHLQPQARQRAAQAVRR